MDQKNQERRSISTARAGTVRHMVAVSTAGAPTMNILSTILRSPHPNMGPGRPEVRGSGRPEVRGSIRGMSPIRVITSLPGTGSAGSPKSSLSPSRTPTILPPKKSLSPSRSIYVESASTNAPTQIVTQLTSQGQGRPGQGQLLSHLPFLAQTLQKGGLSHEKIFQQYKGQDGAPPQSQPIHPSQQPMPAGLVGRASPGPGGQRQPRPAHQRVVTPPPVAVTSIRRTPSPAHMPLGGDVQARWTPEQQRSQAVNLVKPHEQLKKVQSQEFRLSDLQQVTNKAHKQIQSQMLQGGLSPITPAELVQMPWSHDHTGLIQTPANSHPLITQSLTGNNPLTSHAQVQHYVSPISRPAGGVSSSAHSSSSSSVISNAPVTGFMPVVLPSQSRIVHISSQSVPVVSSFVSRSRPSVSSFSKSDTSAETVLASKSLGSLGSVSQAGPPNITISNRSSIPTQEKAVQKIPKNPFTFPATPPASLSNDRPAFQASQSNLVIDEDLTNEKKRHSSDDMPQLSPVGNMKKGVDEHDEELVSIPYALNMRIQTLANFPNNPHNRPAYRATSVAIDKAKRGCIISPAKSLDIVRENLQKSLNKEIDAVIQTYMDKYFKVGIRNIRLNNGENSVTDDHINAVRRQILEEAKKMYLSVTESGRQSVSPARDVSGNVSDAGSSGRRSALGKRRHPSDTDSEASLKPTFLKKKKGRYFVNLTGRSTPSKLAIQQTKREGPKFEPERLTEETMFVMGSKANKAMGFGATRGRLYMKHPDLFKYNGDQDDKTWLYEHQHMPATGGKSYLIVLNDVRELALSDEYKDTPGITVEALSGFTVPMWMIEKMRMQMVAMRTDLPKQAKYRSRSATPNVTEENLDVESPRKELPFACFSSPKHTTMLEASPADDDMDFLMAESNNRDTPSQLSPFNMTGGFDDTVSQSDIDTMDDDPTFVPGKVSG